MCNCLFKIFLNIFKDNILYQIKLHSMVSTSVRPEIRFRSIRPLFQVRLRSGSGQILTGSNEFGYIKEKMFGCRIFEDNECLISCNTLYVLYGLS